MEETNKEKLERLRTNMINAKKAYDDFILNNSKVVEDDPKLQQFPNFIDVPFEKSESREIIMTADNYQEWKKIQDGVLRTQKEFASGYLEYYENGKN